MPLSRAAILSALVCSLAYPASAQSAGAGYLFGAPAGRVTIRAGYAHAYAQSDVFDDAVKFLTLTRGSFSGPNIGGDVAFTVRPWLDLAFSADYSAAVSGSEFRKFLDNNNLPIEQTTSFRRAPVMANAIVYLAPRGRAVGTLAWIPARIVPWVGAGGGAMWYRFRQEGDFVNYQTLNVFTAKLQTSGWAPAFQALGGLDVTLSPRFAISAEARRAWAQATPGGDFTSYDKVDLSGLTGSLGFTIRL